MHALPHYRHSGRIDTRSVQRQLPQVVVGVSLALYPRELGALRHYQDVRALAGERYRRAVIAIAAGKSRVVNSTDENPASMG